MRGEGSGGERFEGRDVPWEHLSDGLRVLPFRFLSAKSATDQDHSDPVQYEECSDKQTKRQDVIRALRIIDEELHE